MDIDEILERAEKVEEKGANDEEGNELLSAFKVSLLQLLFVLHVEDMQWKMCCLFNICQVLERGSLFSFDTLYSIVIRLLISVLLRMMGVSGAGGLNLSLLTRQKYEVYLPFVVLL